MKKLLYKKGITIVCVSMLIVIITTISLWDVLGIMFSEGNYKDVDDMVTTMMDKSATPGVAMVISKQGEIEYRSYGYADVKNRKMVTEDSLFELGSTTKAFTALAIILLEEEGYLSTSDCVSDYLSWFMPTYKGEQTDITIDQLLAHTSGIPSWSIQLIQEGTTEDMLEKTIRNLSDITLDTYPGIVHNYATINYDVLALIIETVTGESFQDFVTDNILLPLGMKDSYFSTGQENISDKLTKGYRLFFGRSIEYNAPRYYGNMAAGYLVTNIKDLGYWINAQMGIGNIPDNLRNAIIQSHDVDKKTAGYEDENRYYSFGWNMHLENKIISHSGSNPNYSSQVIIDLENKEAIFVLTNSDSTVPTQIANNLYENMNGRQMNKFSYDDLHILLDLISSILAIIAVVSLCLKINKLIRWKKQNIKIGKNKFYKIIGISIGLVFRIILLVLVIIWPYLMNYNYYLIRIWMSNVIFVWEGLVIINCILTVVIKIRRIAAISIYSAE